MFFGGVEISGGQTLRQSCTRATWGDLMDTGGWYIRGWWGGCRCHSEDWKSLGSHRHLHGTSPGCGTSPEFVQCIFCLSGALWAMCLPLPWPGTTVLPWIAFFPLHFAIIKLAMDPSSSFATSCQGKGFHCCSVSHRQVGDGEPSWLLPTEWRQPPF